MIHRDSQRVCDLYEPVTPGLSFACLILSYRNLGESTALRELLLSETGVFAGIADVICDGHVSLLS